MDFQLKPLYSASENFGKIEPYVLAAFVLKILEAYCSSVSDNALKYN